MLQWLYLPSGLYILISPPVRDVIRRSWSHSIQLIPEISLDPLHKAESSLLAFAVDKVAYISTNFVIASNPWLKNSSVKRE